MYLVFAGLFIAHIQLFSSFPNNTNFIMSETNSLADSTSLGLSRRRFFGYAGALTGAGLLAGMSSCREDEYVAPVTPAISLGSGDTAILNYAYALEQLEAAFYIQVMAAPYTGMTAAERTYLTEIRDHEIAHRELFKAALGSKAIPALTTNFSSIDFTSRASVLGAARTFEDLGVSAYNGAGIYISDPNNLTLAGKIVSVEARHAAVIRELLQPNSFANTSILNIVSRIDVARPPQDVLVMVAPYLVEKIDSSSLPTA
jgi:hypothetical protein